MPPTPEQKRLLIEYLRQPQHLRRLDLERFSRERLGASRRTVYKWRQLPEIKAALEVDLEGVQEVREPVDDRNEILAMLKEQIALGNVAAAKLLLDQMASPQTARCRRGYKFGDCPIEKTESELGWLAPGTITVSYLRFLEIYVEECGTIDFDDAVKKWLQKNDSNCTAKRLLTQAFGEDSL